MIYNSFIWLWTNPRVIGQGDICWSSIYRLLQLLHVAGEQHLDVNRVVRIEITYNTYSTQVVQTFNQYLEVPVFSQLFVHVHHLQRINHPFCTAMIF